MIRKRKRKRGIGGMERKTAWLVVLNS